MIKAGSRSDAAADPDDDHVGAEPSGRLGGRRRPRRRRLSRLRRERAAAVAPPRPRRATGDGRGVTAATGEAHERGEPLDLQRRCDA